MSVRDTSVAAYNEIKDSGLLSQRRWEVYQALYIYGPLTGSELFREMSYRQLEPSNSNVTTRLGELRAMGVVTEIRERPCSVTGMTVIEWDVTSKLPTKLKKSTRTKCVWCDGKGWSENG